MGHLSSQCGLDCGHRYGVSFLTRFEGLTSDFLKNSTELRKLDVEVLKLGGDPVRLVFVDPVEEGTYNLDVLFSFLFLIK